MWRWIGIMVIVPSIGFAEVGEVTGFDGNPAGAVRSKEELVFEQAGFGVEMLDKLITAQTNLEITFADDSKVRITEQSELVIDDFVYDPNTGLGGMSMKVALGTVQMASGRLAQNSRDRVSIRTPTASITVRGTDFSMTVDEIGRSLIILLPSCPDPTLDEDECPVGQISVSNAAGSVLLTEAYEGTMVSGLAMMPSDPRKLLLERANINNNLIIVPPSEFANGFATDEEDEEQLTALDVDLLEYNELGADLLDEDLLNFSELDINRLDGDYLDNFLELGLGIGLDENELDEAENSILPTVSKYPWITWAANESYIYIESDRQPHISIVTVSADTHGTYKLTQDEYTAILEIQDGGDDINITVVQKQ
jgi:hypothetical protein